MNRHTVAMIVLAVVSLAGAAAAEPQTSAPADHDCLLEPSMDVELGTAVSGVIEKITVDRGDSVKKGVVVATLRAGAEQAAVNLARARAEFGLRREQRNAELYRDELISDNDKDEVATERLIAELELQAAQVQLELRTIRSPIDGVVVERYLAPGEFVTDARVLRLAQLDPLYAEVVAPVSLIGTIEVGMRATVTPQSPLGGSHAASVTVVDSVIDAASGTFGVRLALPNPGHRIPAGVRCVVHFEAAAAAAQLESR